MCIRDSWWDLVPKLKKVFAYVLNQCLRHLWAYIIFNLRGHVARDFEVRGTLFRPPSNYGSNQFFSLKTAWGSHPNGFQRSKRRVSGLSEFFFQKSRWNQAKMKICQKRWKKAKNGFLWLPNIVCNYFYYPSPSNGPKKPFSAFSGDFWSFLVYPLRAQKKVGQNASNRDILA